MTDLISGQIEWKLQMEELISGLIQILYRMSSHGRGMPNISSQKSIHHEK